MNNRITSELPSLIKLYKTSIEKQVIEKKIFDCFNSIHPNRLDYKILANIFKDHNLNTLMKKANNVYIGALANHFLDSVNDKSPEQIKHDFLRLKEVYSNFEESQLYSHYLKISLYFKIKNIFYEEPITANKILDERLKVAGWEYKRNLYYSAIKEIIKYDDQSAQGSIVIISNRQEDYFINNLLELRKQADTMGSKIVFVSNNPCNNTQNVLQAVDTFVQLSDNLGDCLPRNIGALFSNGNLVIFVEDDGIPASNFIKSHYDIHKRPEILSLRGCCLPIDNGNIPVHYWLGMDERIAPPVLEGNSSFKKNTFYEVGGWGDYLFFGHGGYEICYRMIHSISSPKQHIYSPLPILYHNWSKPDNLLDSKHLRHHALWHLLRSRHHEFYKLQHYFNC